jgi:hypothetical protein
MLCVIYAECRYAECYNNDLYVQCHYAECRGAVLGVFYINGGTNNIQKAILLVLAMNKNIGNKSQTLYF